MALSRAFGDFRFKEKTALPAEEQAVTAFPDITERNRSENDKFIMLACDGIWDCLPSKECIKLLEKKVENHKASFGEKSNLTKPVEEMFSEILAPNLDAEDGVGTDNMTAILIYFHQNMSL